MKLSDELKKCGITKSQLAEEMNVSRQTVQRMGEEITPEVRMILNAAKEPEYTWLDLPVSAFEGRGRGTPAEINGKMCVMVSRGWIQDEGEMKSEQGIISEKDWKARLDYTCRHGRDGWSCKICLK